MPTIKETFLANEKRTYNFIGGFFKLFDVSLDVPITIRLYSSRSGEREDLTNVLGGVAVAMPFDSIEIENGGFTQDIHFIVASNRVEYERLSVEVSNIVDAQIVNCLTLNTIEQLPVTTHFTVGTSAIPLCSTVPVGKTRYALHFRNAGTVDIWISPDPALTAGFGSVNPGDLIRQDERLIISYPIYSGAYYAITGSSGNLIVAESTL